MRSYVDRYLARGCYVDNFTANAGAGGDTFGAAFRGATWGREGDRITVDGVDRWVLDALESAP